MANLDYDIPNGPGMVYYIGSDSKQFAAASIALLALDGTLSLDDDIRKYVPEMPDYGTPITIRHLIHHTSGIRDIYTLMSLAGIRSEDVFPDADALALIARQKALNFAPGDDYLYSNSGYFLLAQIVKRVTGQSLREYADEKIFRPLGMMHTHFHDDPGHVMKNRAMSYGTAPGGAFRITYLQNFDKIGAGGLYSTVDDLRKWDENFYTHRVGGEALQRLLHTRGVLNNGDTLTYAFGNNVTTYRGLRTVEHGGTYMGYKAYFLRFPDQRFSVIEQCNLGTIDPQPLAYAIAEIYLGDRMQPKTERPTTAAVPRVAGESSRATPVTLDSAAVAPLVGSYYSEELDAMYRVTWAGGRLLLTVPRSSTMPLAPTGSDAFRAGSLTVRFERTASGAPATALSVDAGRVRNIRFRRG
jgi:CubicO group peptidase (beta-lactamase class C family)